MPSDTLFFTNPYHLSLKLKQLVITDKASGTETTRPIEDMKYVILEHPYITITQQAVQTLADNNVAVIFCNQNFMPSSMLLHFEGHQLQNERFRTQLDASEPLKKQLWQQTVKYKIGNQAALLKKLGKDGGVLETLKQRVLSGDTSNEEAKAARIYWNELFGNNFRREREGVAPNHLLNYGYTILRAATARALAGSGLLPLLGIHHHNRYNAFCLADDIMEPYRPCVDEIVYAMWQEGVAEGELTREIKTRLVWVVNADVLMRDERSPLNTALSQTTASLAKCFAGEERVIRYPDM
jgi:CRISPR-associated protein Cas1